MTSDHELTIAITLRHHYLVTQATESQKVRKMEDVPDFPDPPAITAERTLAIIKPDAVKYAEDIIEEIKSNGFTILQVAKSIEC